MPAPPPPPASTPHLNGASNTASAELPYQRPYDWDALLAFLKPRALRGVEWVDEDGAGRYLRTVSIGGCCGWLAVSPAEDGRSALCVTMSGSLGAVLPDVLVRVERQFDVGADPGAIAERLGALAVARPGLRLPGAFDGFEAAVRAVLGQQVSVKAATTFAGRLVEAFGEPAETPFAALTHLAPTVERLAGAELGEIRRIGVIATRTATLIGIARECAARRLLLEPGADPTATLAALRALPGVGEWTAQYVAMRALSWPDAFPHTDLGIVKALGERNPRRVLEIAESWRPWRAYAVMHLWRSLEAGVLG